MEYLWLGNRVERPTHLYSAYPTHTQIAIGYAQADKSDTG